MGGQLTALTLRPSERQAKTWSKATESDAFVTAPLVSRVNPKCWYQVSKNSSSAIWRNMTNWEIFVSKTVAGPAGPTLSAWSVFREATYVLAPLDPCVNMIATIIPWFWGQGLIVGKWIKPPDTKVDNHHQSTYYIHVWYIYIYMYIC